MNVERKSLTQLFVPIYFETLFYMLAGMVDTLMLSSVSDNAVGAVGTSNTYISVFIMMFSIISSGMVAVMTQNIGAGRPGVAYQARQIGLAFNMVTGGLMSLFLFLFSGKLLVAVGIAEALAEPATVYLKIVGGCCFLNALIPIFASYLRAFGFTKNSLYASMVGNVVNLILNAFFLFSLHMGVAGVAYATVISRMVNLCMVAFMAAKLIHAKENPERLKNSQVLGQIVKIGLPSALETIMYNVAMTLVIRFLNQMDREGLNVTARSYTVQICNFALCAAGALAQANAIITGWHIGAKEFAECERKTRKAAIIAVAVSASVELVLALCGRWIVPLFTDDPFMVELVVKLLFIDVALEVGRAINLVYGQALKTSGDALFTVILAAIFMYLCAVGGTYVFGIRMELMAVGAYIGLASDECCRAVGMVLRWKSGKWKTKRLVEE